MRLEVVPRRGCVPRRRPAQIEFTRGRLARGFTLIELMVAVAVVALLAAVAMPSYQASVRKARRADARSALVTTAQLMERFATERGASGYSTATLNNTAGTNVVAKSTSDGGYYTLTLTGLSATAFTLNAIPQGGQAADQCATFTLNESGVRGVSGGTLTTSDCW